MTEERDEEKYYFEYFRQDYSLPHGEIRRGKGNGLDYVLEGAKKIGIEITQFYEKNGSDVLSEQQQSKLRQEIILEAELDYEENHGGAIRLTLGFNRDNPITDRRKLKQKLVELASRLEDQSDGKIEKRLFDDIPELGYVYLDRPPKNQGEDRKMEKKFLDDVVKRSYVYFDKPWYCWFDVGSGRGPGKMPMARLREIVKEKEEKSKKYEPCDAYWLLVVVNYANPAQDHEIKIDFEPVSSAVFHKILVYRTHVRELQQVPTIKVDPVVTGSKAGE